MDETDLAIFRELTRGRVFFWTSLDPRVSAEDVARRLKLSPTTVRSRIRAWERSGFLAGRVVLPHPALLDLKLGSGSIRIDDPRAKPGVLRALELVPGALAALDHVGCWLAFSVLAESEAGHERVRRLVAKLPGVDEASPCRALHPPPPRKSALSAMEWRVLQTLREDPRRSLVDAARAARVTPKTFSRHYEGLLKDNAALFVPLLDLSKIDGVVARLFVAPSPGADRATLLGALRRMPRLMDAFDGSALLAVDAPLVDVWLHASNPAAAEDAQRRLLETRGVESVELTFPVAQAFFTAWLDDAIAARATP